MAYDSMIIGVSFTCRFTATPITGVELEMKKAITSFGISPFLMLVGHCVFS
ncbi:MULTISPECIES: hypothetical protein [Vibrio]|uniref:hypothetical protein n=1 Tax=Vibrio TaxID=662 RepID=UPI001481F2DA|nr:MULTISPECIES: hypothetical protein [Vibrio]